MQPREKIEVIDHKRYNTETATLIAGDDYWDGHNFERHGRQTFLYMTPKGNYFATYLTCWQNNVTATSWDLQRLLQRHTLFLSHFTLLSIEANMGNNLNLGE